MPSGGQSIRRVELLEDRASRGGVSCQKDLVIG
jgi:hypothetical protein